MKRRTTLSIALVLSVVLVSLMSSDSTANAAAPRTYVANTGMITLGPNQLLRITVAAAAGVIPTGTVTFTIDNVNYVQGTCSDDGVCSHIIASQTTTDPVTLRPGEAASLDITPTPNSSGVRGLVVISSDSRTFSPSDTTLNFLIVDTDTGRSGPTYAFQWGNFTSNDLDL